MVLVVGLVRNGNLSEDRNRTGACLHGGIVFHSAVSENRARDLATRSALRYNLRFNYVYFPLPVVQNMKLMSRL